MRRIISLGLFALLMLVILLLLSPMPVTSQTPTRTPNLDATATRAQLNLNRGMTSTAVSATRAFVKQYRTASYAQIVKYSTSSTQNVTFRGVLGNMLSGNVVWVRVGTSFLLVQTDAPITAQLYDPVTVYATVTGRMTVQLGQFPVEIPKLEHGIMVVTGKGRGSGAVQPPPPTLTPVPTNTPFACPRSCATAVAAGLNAQQAGTCRNLDRDHDGEACYGN